MYMYEQIKQKHGYALFLDLIGDFIIVKKCNEGEELVSKRQDARLAALEGRVRWD